MPKTGWRTVPSPTFQPAPSTVETGATACSGSNEEIVRSFGDAWAAAVACNDNNRPSVPSGTNRRFIPRS
jgi:hypothetical protein